MRRCVACLEPTSPATRPRPRRASSTSTSYDIDLDLTTGDTTFGSTTTIRFTCREPGASTFADLVGATVHEITLNGEPVDPSAYADSRIALTDLAGRQRAAWSRRLRLQPHRRGSAPLRRPGRRPGLPLHAVRGARRPPGVRHVRAARPQGVVHLHRHGARALEGRLQLPDARARGGRRRARRSGTSRRPSAMSTYITALVAGEYHEVRDTYDGKHGEIPLGLYCRQSLVEYLDADEIFEVTKQGFEFFEDAFDYPVPVRQVRPAFVPEYNMGAMENAGCVTLPRRVPPRSRQARSFYEVRANTILHEMAHMWFGDLVTMKWWDDLWLNESFAEWACHHAAVEATEYDEAWTGFSNARKNWAYRQDQLPSHPPDRGGQLRPRGRRGQLRRHHLRQGRLGAQAARRLGRPGARSSPGSAATSRSTPSATPSSPTCSRRSRRPPGRELRVVGQGVAADLRRQHAARRVRGRRRTAASRRSRSRRPRTRTTRRCAGTASASASTTSVDGRPGAPYARSRSTSSASRTEVAELVGAEAARPGAAQRRRPDLRQDPPRRALAGHAWSTSIDPLDDSLARALCWGAAWDMTRDAEMRASDFVDLVLRGHRRRDRRVGVSAAPGLRRAGGRRRTPPRRNRDGAARDAGRAGCASCSRAPSRAATTSCTFVRALRRPPRAADAGARPSLEGLLDGTLVARRPRGRHRPALDAAARRWPRRPRRRAPGSTTELERDNTISGQEHAAAARAR